MYEIYSVYSLGTYMYFEYIKMILSESLLLNLKFNAKYLKIEINFDVDNY